MLPLLPKIGAEEHLSHIGHRQQKKAQEGHLTTSEGGKRSLPINGLAHTYKRHDAQQDMGIFPELIVGSAAKVSELLEARRGLVSCVDDIGHVWCENKWHTISLNGAKHLSIAKNATKVYVEHVASLANHDIVIVSVTNTKNIRGYTVPSAGVGEIFYSLWSGRGGIEEEKGRNKKREGEKEEKEEEEEENSNQLPSSI